MSASTLQAIWPGEKHETVCEYRNSWCTAPIVWGEFCSKYFGKDSSWWLGNCSTSAGTDFWALWKKVSIPESHRAVFLWTMDHMYVKRADYRRFAKDLREFLDATMVSANHVNHWPLIAQRFEMEPDFPALALWCTTVTSDPWNSPYDEESDQYEPFDWTKSCDVYTELDELSEPALTATEVPGEGEEPRG